MKFYFLIAFICVPAFASQDVIDSQANNNKTISSLQQSLTVAQQAMNTSCVTPTTDLMCNTATATIANTVGSLSGQLTTTLGGNSTTGTVISSGISAISCALIKCDTTKLRNKQCNGYSDSSVLCPSSGTTTPETAANSCKASKTVTDAQTQVSNNCPDDPEAGKICSPATSTCSAAVKTCDDCEQNDNSSVNNTYDCSGTDYYTCITSYKTKAKTRELKCIALCATMTSALASLNLALNGTDTQLTTLKDQTTNTGNGDNDNGGNNNNNKPKGNNNNTVIPDDGTTVDLGPSSSSPYSSSPSPSSLGASIGAPKGSGSATEAGASTSDSLGQGAGSLSGLKGSNKEGSGSVAESAGEPSSYAGSQGGVSSSGGGASTADSGSKKLKGITKNSINKQEFLDKGADLFATIQKTHTDLYMNNIIGKDAVNKVSNKNVSKKKAGG